MLTADEAKRLRVLLAEATPGPWEVDMFGDVTFNGEDVARIATGDEHAKADAHLIALLRNKADALLALHDAVMAAPVATFEVEATHDHRALHLRDADPEVLLLKGQRVRLVPDCGPTAEAKEG